MVPCNFAWPKSDNNGINVVVIIKPIATNHQSGPELNPKRGGRIKLPAPKKPANRAKPKRKICLVSFIIWSLQVLSRGNRN
jgi:hypothetical protein